MQAHRDSSTWDTFEVTFIIKVQAKDRSAAQLALFTVACRGEAQGLDWENPEDFRLKVEVLPKEDDQSHIQVHKKEVT